MFGFPIFEFLMLVLGFGFLIFVHELGHFMVAKWVGIRCPQFAIGFGHAMVSWRKGLGFRRGGTEKEYLQRAAEHLASQGKDPEKLTQTELLAAGDELGLSETEYRLNYLPLGGYVKMLGQEDIDPNAQSDDPRAYNNKPIWARACVISAGVVMNIIFGAIFLTAAFMMGVDFNAPTVGFVQPGMPAATTFAEGHDGDLRYLGLREGDDTIEINGKQPEDFKQVMITTALGRSGQAVTIVVKRRGLDEPLTFVITPQRADDSERMLSAGFRPGYGLNVGYNREGNDAVVEWFEARLEAHSAASREKDQAIHISAINGQAVESYSDYLLAFDQSQGMPLLITLTDPAGDETFELRVKSNPTLVRYPDAEDSLLGMVPSGRVSAVIEDGAFERAGGKTGDILVSIGDAHWPSTVPQIAGVIAEADGKPLDLVVLRDGERVELNGVEPIKDKLGIGVTFDYDSAVIGHVLEGFPAHAIGGDAGFLPGTTITHINDTPVNDWRDIQRVLLALAQGDSPPETLAIRYRLPTAGAPSEVVELAINDQAMTDLLAAGWAPDHFDYQPNYKMVTLKADGPIEGLVIGAGKTREFILQTYLTLLRLIQGDIKIYNLRGPVGIVHVGTIIAQNGFPHMLYFLGLISINLAVVNFLPIPIVDGGHIVFLIIEKIKGSPPSPRVQAAALYVGLGLIGFVFLATLFYDVTRLLGV